MATISTITHACAPARRKTGTFAAFPAGSDAKLLGLGESLAILWGAQTFRKIERDPAARMQCFDLASRVVHAIEQTEAETVEGICVKAKAVRWRRAFADLEREPATDAKLVEQILDWLDGRRQRLH